MEVAQYLTQYQVCISVMLTHHSWRELRVTFCNQDVHKGKGHPATGQGGPRGSG